MVAMVTVTGYNGVAMGDVVVGVVYGNCSVM